jgi:AraC-like DNA-binding protein
MSSRAVLADPSMAAAHPFRPEAAAASGPLRAEGLHGGSWLHDLPLTVVHLSVVEWHGRQRFQRLRCERPTIELVLDGVLRLVQDGRDSVAHAGEVLVLKQGSAQLVSAVGEPVRRLVLGLAGDMATPLLARLPDRVVPATGGVRSCFDLLQALLARLPADYQLRASAVAYRLLLHLTVAQGGALPSSVNPTVAAALRILERSGARDLDVRQVARAVDTSVSHLHRLFKEAVGTSPLRYARAHLVRQAKEALSNTSLSCQEIARRLGYDDPLYFSAVFKRVTGESPREFRRRQR